MADDVTPADAQHLIEPPPSPRRRKWIALTFVAFLISQVWIPAQYYINGRVTSEIFAWRMFSSVHMAQWQCRVVETIEVEGQPVKRDVPLAAVVQESMVNGLSAGQLDCAEAFLKRWLERDGVLRVEYEAQGVWPSGEPIEPIRLAVERGQSTVQRL